MAKKNAAQPAEGQLAFDDAESLLASIAESETAFVEADIERDMIIARQAEEKAAMDKRHAEELAPVNTRRQAAAEALAAVIYPARKLLIGDKTTLTRPNVEYKFHDDSEFSVKLTSEKVGDRKLALQLIKLGLGRFASVIRPVVRKVDKGALKAFLMLPENAEMRAKVTELSVTRNDKFKVTRHPTSSEVIMKRTPTTWEKIYQS